MNMPTESAGNRPKGTNRLPLPPDSIEASKDSTALLQPGPLATKLKLNKNFAEALFPEQIEEHHKNLIEVVDDSMSLIALFRKANPGFKLDGDLEREFYTLENMKRALNQPNIPRRKEAYEQIPKVIQKAILALSATLPN